MHPKLRQLSRQLHLWFALAIIIPSLIVFGSGILLQVKKQFDWVQPPTMTGTSTAPAISFQQILQVAQSVPELEVSEWQQIDRIDVRPDKGIMKVVASNRWEAQIDARTGDILHVAYRRSDIIESIHDGSWFAESAKLWLFLPAGILLFLMWCSGAVLLVTTLKSKLKKRSARVLRS
ncbi:PepSY-associated TM helix domain-containing protein [Arsukibacterium sp.]|uniref:PepSY-associated TM helix domain-containing protein n=1 Tax=Arsukibacterium sp. TaxID=1977258 RepID=UPI00299D885F|nr:PepSY-associated TM helix domain-containing protein [Arsukibacterium sp.]MDX1678709.1 PepSY-associated TM helix domain-containing protein [Arsukibacterium sp.]